MVDLIDRQAAIDAVSEYATIWMSYTDDMSASDIAQEAINSAKDTMIRILKEQPTAQPVLTCKGCRYDGYYKHMQCRNCLRKERDLYEPE